LAGQRGPAGFAHFWENLVKSGKRQPIFRHLPPAAAILPVEQIKESLMGSFLSIQDAADYLGVDYKTVYRLVRAGQLPAGKVGGMYRIRKEDLEAYFQAQVAETAGRRQEGGMTTVEPLPKCGHCYQILRSPRDVAATCAFPGCDRPLCAACAGKGVQYCDAHRPTSEERLAQARAALARGEIPLLVTALEARQAERAWIARFDERMRGIASLYHPGTAEVLRVADWAPFHEAGDDSLGLMQLLNVGFLDRATQATLPHNEYTRYRIEAGALGWGRPRQGLILQAHCIGHLADFVEQGFDTRPADLEELLLQLADLEKLAAEAQATVIAGLASPTGWDDPAVAHIADPHGRAYRHPSVLPCLVDLASGEVHFNLADERLGQLSFAELFKLPLEAEEVAATRLLIENALVGKEGLPVRELARQLNKPLALVRRACEELAADGHFKLVQDASLGAVLMRRRI